MPAFALDLDHDGIRLLRNAFGEWSVMDAVALDDPGLPRRLREMRDAAERAADGPLETELIIPPSQILYTSIPRPDGNAVADRAYVARALEGLTPCPIEETVFDWREEGDILRVAALDTNTLDEAETFAATYGFNPVRFSARPAGGEFPVSPDFGPTQLAVFAQADESEALITPEPEDAGTAPTPDPQPEGEIGLRETGDLHAEDATQTDPAPAAVDEEAPDPATPKAHDADAIDAPPEPVDTPQEPALATPEDPSGHDLEADLGAPNAPEAEPAPEPAPNTTDAEGPEAPPDADASEADQAALPTKAEPIEETAPRGDGPVPVFRHSEAAETDADPIDPDSPDLEDAEPPDPEPVAALDAQEPMPTDFTDPVAGLTDGLSGEEAPPLYGQAPDQSEPGLQTRALPEAEASSEPDARTPPFIPPTRARSAAAPTPPNAAGARPVPGPAPRPPLASILKPAAAALLLCGVLIWTALYLVTPKVETSLPEVAETPQPTDETEPEAPRRAPSRIPPILTTLAPLPPLPGPEAIPNVQAAMGARRGVELVAVSAPDPTTEVGVLKSAETWQTPDAALVEPVQSANEEIYLAAIDPVVMVDDALALVTPEQGNSPLQTRPVPPQPEAEFDFDERGLVRATPEGAVTPEGIVVTLGRPPLEPPKRPDAAIEADNAAQARILEGKEPRTRPGDLVERAERANFGGRTKAELSGFRPKPRPVSAQRAALGSQADQSPSGLAVAVSRAPSRRPADFAAIVALAQQASRPAPQGQTGGAAPVQSASAAAVAPVQPRIPTTASVARQATIENAINLRRLNLIGVYGTDANRRALIRLPSGRYVKVKVGDRINGGQVAAIGDGEIRFIKGGRSETLKVPSG